jgi:CDP-diacylglycerol--glycerol-3-phosphate 3-phosphatidyltransferase
VDKILVTGTFIFLLDIPASGLNAWMVTIVVAREFIVTGLRGFLEEKGVQFGADWLGKIKMLLQCAAILWILLFLSLTESGATAPGLALARDLLNWSMVLVTFISGANYVRRAVEHLA